MAKSTLRLTLIGTAMLCSVLNISNSAFGEAEKKSVKVEVPTDPILPADQLAEKALELTQPVAKPVQTVKVTQKVQTAKATPKAQAKVVPANYRAGNSFVLKATAYNSFVGQTDATPNITATGSRTRFGVVALSRDMLRKIPYGSKVKIELLGAGASYYNRMLSQTVFFVEDTMHPRKYGQVDIWMRTMSEARAWGVRQVKLTILK
ncbi:3D domain-containing protein [Deinococcus misasensis]|uniref:3D domain-containing protein n=1 Tax=Deinococcus misasensis TaxID=392413 RepID=UPI0009FF070B|nr:3D domain-containing protein [Deinococcus misasensis]